MSATSLLPVHLFSVFCLWNCCFSPFISVWIIVYVQMCNSLWTCGKTGSACFAHGILMKEKFMASSGEKHGKIYPFLPTFCSIPSITSAVHFKIIWEAIHCECRKILFPIQHQTAVTFNLFLYPLIWLKISPKEFYFHCALVKLIVVWFANEIPFTYLTGTCD